jgi:hypothetical protein
MLYIRMSRTPIEGSPVPRCLTPRRVRFATYANEENLVNTESDQMVTLLHDAREILLNWNQHQKLKNKVIVQFLAGDLASAQGVKVDD